MDEMNPGGEQQAGEREGGGTPRPVFDRGASWLRAGGLAPDVVLSSRVRIARNLAGFPFMPKADRNDRAAVLDAVRPRVLELASPASKLAGREPASGGGLVERVMWIDLHETPRLERSLLTERHLISKQHARGKLSNGSGGPEEPRAVAIGMPNERLSIMVNEEDHLRVQVLRPGLDLRSAFEEVDAVDDALEANLEFAFHPRFGYLTGCPTNVGTGVRFSVMLHLPALAMTGEIDKVKRSADAMDLAVRGFYGEGSEAAGHIYQISNQTTLGKSEQVLMHDVEREVVRRLIDYERHARARLLRTRRSAVEDRAWRALGVLRHAHLLSAEEAMELLSSVRLGLVAGVFEDDEPKLSTERVHKLLVMTQQAHLQRSVGRELNQMGRRSERARLVREELCSD